MEFEVDDFTDQFGDGAGAGAGMGILDASPITPMPREEAAPENLVRLIISYAF